MIPLRTRLAVVFVMACLLAAAFLLFRTNKASSRPRVPAPVFKAVRANWKTRPERVKALDVAACETGGTYSTTASNGQYLGIWQMGAWARSRYGHGPTVWAQARAAYHLYLDCGWNQWSCA